MGRAVIWVIAIGIASGVAAASIPSEPSTAVPDEAIEAAAVEQSAAHLILMGAGLLGLLLLGGHSNLRPARSVIAWSNLDSCREDSVRMIETASPLRVSAQRIVEVTEDRRRVEVAVRDARPADSLWFGRLGLGSVRLHDPHDRRVGRIAFRTRHDLDPIGSRGNRDDRNRTAENPVLEIRIALAASAAGPVSTDRG